MPKRKREQVCGIFRTFTFKITTMQHLNIEIEAQDQNGLLGEQELYEQCRLYMEMLGIRAEELAPLSYGDMFNNP